MIERAQELLKLITKYDHAYFTENKSLISDDEYDELYYELNELMKDKTVQKTLKKEGVPLGAQHSHLDKVKHLVPVLSLDKLKMDDKNFVKKLTNFVSKYNQNDEWSIQSKLDGLTIVDYNNGKAVFTTRGASNKGENVTMQFEDNQHLMEVLKNVPDGTIIRGEAVIKVNDFELIVSNQMDDIKKRLDGVTDELVIEYATSSIITSELQDAVKTHLKTVKDKQLSAIVKARDNVYTNARNLASSLVRNKEKNPLMDYVEFVAYDIMNSEKLGYHTEEEILNQLSEWGFETVRNKTVSTDELYAFFENKNQDAWRDNEVFEIDGLVIKPNLKIVNPEVTGHHEKGQLALKYAPAGKETILRSVEWTVGQNGRLSPVGVFDEIHITGSNITKASLGSWKTIEDKDLRLGDRVYVVKANDVIPQVSYALTDKRDGSESAIEFPKNAHLDGGIVYSDDIELSLEERLSRFAKAIELKSAKSSTFKKLIDAGYLSNIDDLYRLKDYQTELYEIKGLGQKKIDTLLDEIENTSLTLEKVLLGLNLKGVGRTSSKSIAEVYPTWNDLKTADINTLSELHGVNKNTVASIQSLIDKSDIIDKLLIYKEF